MSQTERAAFEDWWMLRGKTRPARSTEPGCADQYAMANAEMAWRGWKAARISASGGSIMTSANACLNCGDPSDEPFCGMCMEMGCAIAPRLELRIGDNLADRLADYKTKQFGNWSCATLSLRWHELDEIIAALRAPAQARKEPVERCLTCGRGDAEYKACDWDCNDPWHADAHLRAKSVAVPSAEGNTRG